MTQTRPIRPPLQGDLIYIKRSITGIMNIGDPLDKSATSYKPWSTGLIVLEPNQTALVLKVYSIDKKEKNINTSTLVDAHKLISAHENNTDDVESKPNFFCILVLSIGDHIVETLYDPNYLDVITTTST